MSYVVKGDDFFGKQHARPMVYADDGTPLTHAPKVFVSLGVVLAIMLSILALGRAATNGPSGIFAGQLASHNGTLPTLASNHIASLPPVSPPTRRTQVPTPQGVDYGYVKLPKNWGELLPDIARPYLGMIDAAGKHANVDPRLLAALIHTESNYNHINPVGPGGISISFRDNGSLGHAIGLTQLLKSTARSQGVDPYNNAQNCIGGANYLRYLLNRFDQVLYTALSAYNGGPNDPSNAAPGYAAGIIKTYRHYGGRTT